MYDIANWIIKEPSSPCDVERALSKYNWIFSDKRHNMKKETVYNIFFCFNFKDLLGELDVLENEEDLNEDFVPINDEYDKENSSSGYTNTQYDIEHELETTQ